MKTKIISFSLLLFLITAPVKAQEWEFVGLDSMVIKQLFVSGDNIWAGTSVRSGANINGGLYFTSNAGNSWIQIDSSLGTGSIVGMENLGNGKIYIIKGLSQFSLAGTLFKTTDFGKNWKTVQQLENLGIDWIGISSFNKKEIYVKQFTYITAGVYETIYRSLDGGGNWQEITFFPASSHGRSLSFNMSNTDSSTLYASVDDRMFDTYFYKSTNKGNSWLYISEPPAIEQELITVTNSPNRIFIFSGYHITEDGGYSWSIADSGLADVTSYLSFYIDPFYKTNFYNLRKDGLFVSKSKPIYWQLIEGSNSLPLNLGSQGFQNWDIGQLRNIFIDTVSNDIYVGTAKGIYKKKLVTDVEETENELPSEYILYQNFPNPFNPSTKIRFSIPANEFVNLSVYNLLGEKIVEIVNETKAAGEYEVSFNAANFPSGIYLAKISAGGFNQAVKMLFLK